jgi:Na+-transporting methylmalonyl-CoA/oxaloacetate decarboxylase beta subunit
MTVKQRAVVQTLGLVALILASSVGVTLILQQLTTDQVLFGLAAGSIALLIYSMYGVILSRLEYQETLKKMVDKQ